MLPPLELHFLREHPGKGGLDGGVLVNVHEDILVRIIHIVRAGAYGSVARKDLVGAAAFTYEFVLDEIGTVHQGKGISFDPVVAELVAVLHHYGSGIVLRRGLDEILANGETALVDDCTAGHQDCGCNGKQKFLHRLYHYD